MCRYILQYYNYWLVYIVHICRCRKMDIPKKYDMYNRWWGYEQIYTYITIRYSSLAYIVFIGAERWIYLRYIPCTLRLMLWADIYYNKVFLIYIYCIYKWRSLPWQICKYMNCDNSRPKPLLVLVPACFHGAATFTSALLTPPVFPDSLSC